MSPIARSGDDVVGRRCYTSVVRRTLLVLTLLGCGASAPSTGGATSGGEEAAPEECTATLRIESIEEAAADEAIEIPRARITAVRHCERSGSSTLAVGTEDGVCTRAASGGDVIAHVSCWWAGAGSEIELVRLGESLVVRRVAVDEMTGPGPAAELGAIGLPEHSELVPLSAAGD